MAPLQLRVLLNFFWFWSFIAPYLLDVFWFSDGFRGRSGYRPCRDSGGEAFSLPNGEVLRNVLFGSIVSSNVVLNFKPGGLNNIDKMNSSHFGRKAAEWMILILSITFPRRKIRRNVYLLPRLQDFCLRNLLYFSLSFVAAVVVVFCLLLMF